MLAFWCPGCDRAHSVSVGSGIPDRDWGFNGNPDSPTFTPSILVNATKFTEKGEAELEQWRAEGCPHRGVAFDHVDTVCHSYVTDGQIQFLGDCTHSHAGQTVPLPDFGRSH